MPSGVVNACFSKSIDYNFGAHRLHFWCGAPKSYSTIPVAINYIFGVKYASSYP